MTPPWYIMFPIVFTEWMGTVIVSLIGIKFIIDIYRK